MGRASFTVTIDCPPNEVFAFVADLRNLSSWYPAIAGAVLIAGQPGEVGSQFDLTTERESGTAGGDVVRYTTESVAPGVSVVFVADTASAVTDTYELTPVDGGTELRYTIDVAHRGWRAPLGPLIDRAARIGLRPLGGALKRRLEPEP